jgi:hypothetical protein
MNIVGSSTSTTNALRIVFNDGPRNLSDRLPNNLTRSVNFDFVGAGTANGTGNYGGVMSFQPWDGTSASTGDSSYQLAFANNSGVNASGMPKLSIRNGIDTTWNAWYTLIHSGTIGAQSVTYATSAGSAGSATTSTYSRYVDLLAGRTDTTAYPVLWGVNQGTNPVSGNTTTYAFSCAAVTITSSTGTLTATTLQATQDVIAYYSSDRRFKDNITKIPNALEKISKIGGYEFDWNNVQSTHKGHDIGVIAQEIEEILPEIVVTRQDGYKSVKYEKIIALLIESTKEQQSQIEDLKKEVDNLKKK